MNIRSKRMLDVLLGRPLAAVLNLAAFLLSRIWRRDHRDDPSHVRTVVISKYVGMGSLLRASAFVAAVRRQYPEARIILVVGTSLRPIGERIGGWDELLTVRDKSLFGCVADIVHVIGYLWRRRVDLFYDLEVHSSFSSIIAAVSGARNRYGFLSEALTFRQGLLTHTVEFDMNQPVTGSYMRLLGHRVPDSEHHLPRFGVSDGERAQALSGVTGLRPGKAVCVLNPNASELCLERRWPSRYWRCLTGSLRRQWDGVFVMIGSREERGYVDRVLAGVAVADVVNAAGEYTLAELIALLGASRLVITVDSGVYHLAASVSPAVVSLWGPGDYRHYGGAAQGVRDVPVSVSLECRPCIYRRLAPPCCGDNRCMKLIHPWAVYTAVCAELGLVPEPALRADFETEYGMENGA
jgi:ADP-heptose:LPS heptosyltransferase